LRLARFFEARFNFIRKLVRQIRRSATQIVESFLQRHGMTGIFLEDGEGKFLFAHEWLSFWQLYFPKPGKDRRFSIIRQIKNALSGRYGT